MTTPVLMPQLGEAVAEGTVERWLKKPGERVRRFEPLLEVMTEKVNTEIPSPVSGVLTEIVAAEGDTVPVGATIAQVEEEAAGLPDPGLTAAAGRATGAATAATGSGAGASPPPPPAAPVEPPGLFPSSPVSPRRPDAAAAPGAPPSGFSPAVRRLAAEYGLDPRLVPGTGAGGRVTREDVVAHANRLRGAGQAAASGAAAGGPAASALEPDVPVPPTAIRRAIAARMVESTRNIPHAWMMVEADVTGLVRLRQAARAEFARREGFDLTYFPFFVKAVVEGLREQPTVNASWTEAGILYHRRINLGVAVAAEDGLVVPVLHAVDGMSVAGIARAVREISTRARAGDLGPADMQGGTFTVNNTGALGSIVSMPIINPPQSGIITLETIQPRPAVVGEGIAIRQIVNLSFSFDHRVADGLGAGRFMQTVRRVMEAYAPGAPVY